MKKYVTEILLSRLIATALIVAVLATQWDIWWHGALGRDTFWQVPHLFLYGSALVAIIMGIYGFAKFRHKIWRNLAIVLAFIPFAGPFDELWHRVFGTEPLNSILIAWSPPHLLIATVFIASFAMLLPHFEKEKEESIQRFFGAFSLAIIFSIALFIISPLDPTGPWGILGYWGAGFGSFFLISIYLYGQRWLPGSPRATLIAVFIILISSITFGEVINPEVDIIPHDHVPAFLVVFALLITGAFIDLMRSENEIKKGLVSGLVWSFIVYYFASDFLHLEFQYSSLEGWKAIASGALGGLVAGVVSQRFHYFKS